MSPDALVAILPRLFTASHLRRLASRRSSDLLPFVRDIIVRENPSLSHPTIGNLLNGAFRILRLRRPVEYVFKSCLLKRLLLGPRRASTTACYFELPVGTARADMVLVNGQADVFEVKSRYDSPARLHAQLREYHRCFALVTVVTEEPLVRAYQSRLPEHVGLSALTRRGSISPKRDPSPYHERLDHFELFRVLRQAERHSIAETCLGLSPLQIHPAVRYRRIFKRFESRLSVMEAHKAVVSALGERQATEALADRSGYLQQEC